MTDIVLLAKVAAEAPTAAEIPPKQLSACDRDSDGAYTVSDAILLLELLVQA